MNQRVMFIVDNLPRAKFFARFEIACQRLGIPFQYLTYRISSYRFLKKNGLDARLLVRSRKPSESSPESHRNLCANSQELVRGEASLQTTCRVAKRLAGQIKNEIDRFQPSHICLWNGSQLVERLVSDECSGRVKTRFLEIANIPGKLFIDPVGVNAASSIYQDPDLVLARGVPTDSEYLHWRQIYLDRFNGKVPQAKAAQAMHWERPLDALASRLGFGYYPISATKMASRFFGKVRSSGRAQELAREFKHDHSAKRPFRFFPLQVSDDTQLLLNSEIGNITALRRVAAHCRFDDIDLLIKIHPAENNRRALQELRTTLIDLNTLGRVHITSRPTTELIFSAEKVYTINSTVGLETLICGQPLEVLGRSFFRSFIGREDRTKAYLLRYLADFDYFASDTASPALLMRVLEDWPCAAPLEKAQ